MATSDDLKTSPHLSHRCARQRPARATRRRLAHAGSRTRVTSMGGLYDAATLHALLIIRCAKTCATYTTHPDASHFYDTRITATRMPGARRIHQRHAQGRRPPTAHLAARTSSRPTTSCARHLPWRELRMPGVEPGSQAWEACTMPLHYMRSSGRHDRGYSSLFLGSI